MRLLLTVLLACLTLAAATTASADTSPELQNCLDTSDTLTVTSQLYMSEGMMLMPLLVSPPPPRYMIVDVEPGQVLVRWFVSTYSNGATPHFVIGSLLDRDVQTFGDPSYTRIVTTYHYFRFQNSCPELISDILKQLQLKDPRTNWVIRN